MSANYDFNLIEAAWQRQWAETQAFRAANPGEPGAERPKYYVLDFFPYPSGAGLHVGHPLGYIASDIIARFQRMRGYNVLHPMGWDAFGLPAEQYAVETGVHPAITTRKNIETYRRQLQLIGLSYDWSREISTCEEKYYRWTQWIFLQIYNAWYDPEHRWTDRAGRQVIGAARPIDKLPIPMEIRSRGADAVADYQDGHRLAYLAEVPVNWCPALGTVLANEEVTNEGRSERGNHPVFRRPMKQWMLRITEYAERLLQDLEHLDWPAPIKLMQRNWIGRSDGAYIDFALADDSEGVIRVFTTRPDTVYGATYLVLAPEHRLTSLITTDAQRWPTEAYVAAAKRKSDLDRTSADKTKTGVFTGAYAINPVSRRRVPIWIADYVLATYGTGSIMGVPGSDKRDLEFAETFGLEVIQVVAPPSADTPWRGYEEDGFAVNSPAADALQRFEGHCDLNGLATQAAKRKITDWLEAHGLGEGAVQYKLRDWLFSRQRYWGEPFPILFRKDGRIECEPDASLPVSLPAMDDFRPTAGDDPNAEPQTPLSRAAHWARVQRHGVDLRREVNTMPNWAGSCWYYLRFLDPDNDRAFAAPTAERYWMTSPGADGAARPGGVDLYMGGAEHAVLHLLYARFWHKLLYDLGHVSTPEPFQKLFNQGMIGAAAYRDERGAYVDAAQVVDGAGRPAIEVADSAGPFYYEGRPVVREMGKMGKSLKNVVNPDSIIAEYGADTLRLYEMYLGPLEAGKPWNTRDIVGVHRFLQRVWRLVIAPRAADETQWEIHPRISATRNEAIERLLHKTIRKVQADIERFALNTAIAQMIVWSNEAQKAESIGRDQIERFILLLAPFAPHLCEELWRRLGHAESLSHAPWPQYDEALTVDDTIEMAVQVRGKLRGRIRVPPDASDEAIVAAAKAVESVAVELGDNPIQRAIVAKGRLVNLII